MTSKRALKVLHVLSQRPDSTGSGIYIQAMLRGCCQSGYINGLIAGIQSERPHPRLDCVDDDNCRFISFNSDDLPFTIVGMSDVMPYASSRFCDLSPEQLKQYEQAFLHHLGRVVKSFGPDIIHSHHLWIVTSLIRQRYAAIPLVTTCHGSDLRQFRNCRHLQARVLKGCRRLDAVMALSEAQKTAIVDLYGLKPQTIHVVGAGYNASLFVPADKPDPSPVRIIYAGKLSRAKGVPWMLRGLSRMGSANWHLDLVGSGSGAEQAECMRQADRLGDRVKIHGMVSQEQLANLMQKAHVFVLPSFFEGLPLVVLEAMASGCRVVVTRLPGVTEILGDLRADFIELIAPPRLVNVDEPVRADEERFETDLRAALERQIRMARLQPDIDLSVVTERMATFTWQGVFKRVEAVYRAHVMPGS